MNFLSFFTSGRGLLTGGFFAITASIAGIFASGRNSTAIIAAVVVITLVIVFGILYVFFRLWKKKKGNALSNLLKRNSMSGDYAGIDSLRSNFSDGLLRLRKAGKNVYDLPWFLLVGQAGAGKTEAIRRSHNSEDFPPGLNDLMQGVGGTLNMNWWFTNKGIILDTAGRIFEEKVVAGASNEWMELLKILKKARKNMPINGLILVIPADSLIQDTVNQIEGKAAHIRDQLTVVQNALGVRFPVFIIISKVDYVPGFREFVENVKDPRLEQQMLGWSNPHTLDEPFSPDHVGTYLEGVVKKLKKRRLSFMLDPHPEGDKRLDDLDSLFTFPNHLSETIPNLKRYLEIVFSLNPWSQKPLFIRGIYFTSSLQQGEALDQELARIMGRNLKDMALSPFKKEKPLFLRDAFFDKIYKEYGLVTSATRVKATMRRRSMIFLIVCVLSIGAILGAAWFGSSSFRKSIGDEYAHWNYAAERVDTESEDWHFQRDMRLVYDNGIDIMVNDEPVIIDSYEYDLPGYIDRMSVYSDTPLEIPKVFRPLKFFDDLLTGKDLNREPALRNIVEHSVVVPILKTSRDKLELVTPEAWDDNYRKGFEAILAIQGILNNETRDEETLKNFRRQLGILYQFIEEDSTKPMSPELEAAFDKVFTPEFARKQGWPDEKYSDAYRRAETAEEIPAIEVGQDLLLAELDKTKDEQRSNVEELENHLKVIQAISDKERTFLETSLQQKRFSSTAVEDLRKDYDDFLATSRKFSPDPGSFRFYSQYETSIRNVQETTEQNVNSLTESITGMMDPNDSLLAEFIDRLEAKKATLIDSFDNMVSTEMQLEFNFYDKNYLDNARVSGFDARLGLYGSLADSTQRLSSLKLDGLDSAYAVLQQARDIRARSTRQLDGYKGYREEDIHAFKKQIEDRYTTFENAYVADFLDFCKNRIFDKVGFPVVVDSSRILSLEEIEDLSANLTGLSDLIKRIQPDLNARYGETLNTIETDISKLHDFITVKLVPSLDKKVNLSLPAMSTLINLAKEKNSDSVLTDNDVLRDTIIWNARFVRFGENREKRLANYNSPLELGSLTFDERAFSIQFMSVLDGQAGDAGSFQREQDWALLRIYLAQQAEFYAKYNGKSIFKLPIPTAGGDDNYFLVIIEFPGSLPKRDDWMRLKDLKSFK